MANLNKVQLIGNLTRDPEIKYTPKGSAIADFSLAINRYYTLESGEKKEEVTFVNVTLYGRQAELAKEYLAKGRPVYIEGRLQLDEWDDKQTGQKRSRMKVIGEQMQFLGSREGGGKEGGDGEGRGEPRQQSQGGGGGGGGGSRPAGNASQQQQQRPQPAQGGGGSSDDDDDIPS